MIYSLAQTEHLVDFEAKLMILMFGAKPEPKDLDVGAANHLSFAERFPSTQAGGCYGPMPSIQRRYAASRASTESPEPKSKIPRQMKQRWKDDCGFHRFTFH